MYSFDNVKEWRLGFVPSLITILALTLGVHAIRFLFLGQVEKAAFCILGAACLDGLDGKVARYLNVSSKFGGMLDTLADFLNFGIVPAIMMYVKYFSIARAEIYWVPVVIYITCTALRLARFSVNGMSDGAFFCGVPVTGAAFLLIFPLCCERALGEYANTVILSYVSMFLLVFIAMLMISNFRTISLSRIRIARKHFSLIAVLLCAVLSLVYLYTWSFIIFLQLVYFISIFTMKKCK